MCTAFTQTPRASPVNPGGHTCPPACSNPMTKLLSDFGLILEPISGFRWDQTMRESLFQLPSTGKMSLQAQIREVLVSAILGGQLPIHDRIPSSRQMARRLGVSRNTVVLAYQGLIDDGYIVARERSGYYVNEEILNGRVESPPLHGSDETSAPDWEARFRVHPSVQDNIHKPANWQEFPYPFIYGQVDHKLFPIAEWRECNRQALGKQWIDAWTSDFRDRDDPMLIEQIRTRILPRRGIMARDDEILVTLGAQNALYLIASLLVTRETVVAMEEPGYPDMRNIFRLRTDRMMPVEVDHDGLVVDDRLSRADIVFTTPSHQFPTTVTMPRDRRLELLEAARAHDLVIVEDDYEFETNYIGEPCPALKSTDRDGRVIYVGSLSKTLFPGLAHGIPRRSQGTRRRVEGAAAPDGAPYAQQQPARGRAFPVTWLSRRADQTPGARLQVAVGSDARRARDASAAVQPHADIRRIELLGDRPEGTRQRPIGAGGPESGHHH